MATPTTYAEWIALLKQWVDTDDLPDSAFATALSLANVRLNRDLNSQYMEAKTTLTLTSAGQQFVLNSSVPDFNRMRSFAQSGQRACAAITYDEWSSLSNTNGTTDGIARYYTIDAQILYFVPRNISGTSYDLRYYVTVPEISPTLNSNVFTQRHPQALLYAALMETEPYLAEDERLPMWTASYNAVRDQINATAVASHAPSGELSTAVIKTGFPSTYDGWIDLVKRWANVPNLTDLDVAVALDGANIRLNRDLNSRYMEKSTIYTSDGSTSEVFDTIIPTFNRMRSVENDNAQALTAITYPAFTDLRATDLFGTAPALYYAIEAERIYFYPRPNTDDKISFKYYEMVPEISSTVDSNIFTINHPQAFLYAALLELNSWLTDDKRLVAWAANYDKIVARINELGDGSKSMNGLAMAGLSTGAWPTKFQGWIDLTRRWAAIEGLTDNDIGIALSSATARLNRDLNSQYMEQTQILVASTTEDSFNLATELTDYGRMRYVTNTNGRKLTAITFAEYSNMVSTGGTGEPLYYAIEAQRLYLFPPTAVSDSFTVSFYQNVPDISGTVDSNIFTINHPQAFLQATLMELSPWVTDPNKLLGWKASYDQYREQINTNALASKGLTSAAETSIASGGWPTSFQGWIDMVKRWSNVPTLTDNDASVVLGLANIRLNRDLNSRYMEKSIIYTSDGSASAVFDTIIPDFNRMRSVENNNAQALTAITYPAFTDLRTTDLFGTAPALYYAIEAERIYFYPRPNTDDEISFKYYEMVPALSSTINSNIFTINHPQAFLYAALMELGPWMADGSRIGEWTTSYETFKARINELGDGSKSMLPIQTAVIGINGYPSNVSGWINLLRRYSGMSTLTDPDLIMAMSMANTKLNLELDSQYMEKQVTYTYPATPVPVDIFSIAPDYNRVRLVNMEGFQSLQVLPWNQMQNQIGALDQGATPPTWPTNYAIESNILYVSPMPEAGAVLNLSYYVMVPMIDDAVPTNIFTTYHPQAFLYAALLELVPFLAEESKAAGWNAQYMQAKNAINNVAVSSKMGSTPLLRRFSVYGPSAYNSNGWWQ